MQNFIFYFRSYTTAMKAYSVLSENGIRSVVGKKTSPSEGCVYTLKINSEYNRAVYILERNKISYFSDTGKGVRI